MGWRFAVGLVARVTDPMSTHLSIPRHTCRAVSNHDSCVRACLFLCFFPPLFFSSACLCVSGADQRARFDVVPDLRLDLGFVHVLQAPRGPRHRRACVPGRAVHRWRGQGRAVPMPSQGQHRRQARHQGVLFCCVFPVFFDGIHPQQAQKKRLTSQKSWVSRGLDGDQKRKKGETRGKRTVSPGTYVFVIFFPRGEVYWSGKISAEKPRMWPTSGEE